MLRDIVDFSLLLAASAIVVSCEACHFIEERVELKRSHDPRRCCLRCYCSIQAEERYLSSDISRNRGMMTCMFAHRFDCHDKSTLMPSTGLQPVILGSQEHNRPTHFFSSSRLLLCECAMAAWTYDRYCMWEKLGGETINAILTIIRGQKSAIDTLST